MRSLLAMYISIYSDTGEGEKKKEKKVKYFFSLSLSLDFMRECAFIKSTRKVN